MHLRFFFTFLVVFILIEVFVIARPHFQGVPLGLGFLQFHTIVEGIVAFIGLLIGCYAVLFFKKTGRLDVFVLSAGFFIAASFDLLHLLSYGGMPTTIIFPSANTSEFFWLVARGALGVALLAAMLISWRVTEKSKWLWLGLGGTAFGIGCVYLCAALFGTDIPRFVSVSGGTSLRAANEIFVAVLYIIAGILFWRRYRASGDFLYLVLAFFTLTILSEFNLTLSLGPYFLSNWLSHAYTLAAFLALLAALVVFKGKTMQRRKT
ncbi:MAG: hypothetical protein HYS73_00915 [Parcubacteria group bacterium]|nr:hypothetical protein [Parcubacteria group bacterium]